MSIGDMKTIVCYELGVDNDNDKDMITTTYGWRRIPVLNSLCFTAEGYKEQLFC